jgi:hypothetical protein
MDDVCQRYRIVVDGEEETLSVVIREEMESGLFVLVSSLTIAGVKPKVIVYTVDMTEFIVSSKPADQHTQKTSNVTIRHDDLKTRLKNCILNALLGFLGPSACILGVPDSTVVAALSFLSVQDLCAATSVCKRIAVSSQLDCLWDDHWRREFRPADEPKKEPLREMPSTSDDTSFEHCYTFNGLSKKIFYLLWKERFDRRKAEEAEKQRHQDELLRYLGRGYGRESRQQYYYSTANIVLPQPQLPPPGHPYPSSSSSSSYHSSTSALVPPEVSEMTTNQYGSAARMPNATITRNDLEQNSNPDLQLPFEYDGYNQAPLRSMYSSRPL